MQVLTPTQAPFTGCRDAGHRENVLEKKLLQLGVRGEPLFADLSYFKCACHLILALLLGICDPCRYCHCKATW